MRKRYTEAEMESQVHSAVSESRRNSEEKLRAIEAEYEEAVQQAFKDGLNRAVEHIKADVEALPESYEITIRVNGATTLHKATQAARFRARKIFGSSFHLIVQVERIRALNPPVLFDFTVTAVRKERSG
jgi:hypothetical protein